jgi:hypothetical protein
LVEKPEGTRQLGRPSRRRKNNIKIDLPEIVSEGLTVINLMRIGTLCWLFEHGDKSFGSIKCRDIVEWLRKYLALKKVCAAWNLGDLRSSEYLVCPAVCLPRNHNCIPCREKNLSPHNVKTAYEFTQSSELWTQGTVCVV